MIGLVMWRHAPVETPCTIEIEQTHDFFHAHIDLDDGVEIGPGDRVQLQGAPIRIVFGERYKDRRTATIERAGRLMRAWVKLTARLRLHDLYEVSFTSGSPL